MQTYKPGEQEPRERFDPPDSRWRERGRRPGSTIEVVP